MTWVRVGAFVVVVAVGCGQSVHDEGAEIECTSNLDCAEGQTCVKEGLSRSTQEYWPGTGGGAGIGQGGTGSSIGGTSGTGTGGCPSATCTPTSCGPGLVCGNGNFPGCPTYMTCQLACSEAGAAPCAAGTLCRPSGVCEPIRCDDAEYPGCPTGMTCDPTVDPTVGLSGRYSIFGTAHYPYVDYDHGAMLSAEERAGAAARCVFLRCDEEGGFECAGGFRCDVANAPLLSSGCAGIPCGELGACGSDAFICEPTSSGPRPADIDVHGCVAKNCEEGRPCADRYRCDAANATSGDGCVPKLCNEPGEGCDSTETKCAPETETEILPSGYVYGPDTYGCVHKRCDIDAYPCPQGMACDPTSTAAYLNGCVVWQDPGVGGTTGTSGTSGTGNAGTTGDPGASGVCR